jgi:hypothetical protein
MHWTRPRFASALIGVFAAVGAIAAPAAERADPNVRVLTTGDNSELVKTIPIGRKRGDRERVVMSLPGSKLGNLGDEMAIEASAELEVTTCLKADPDHPGSEDQCTGKTYGFDPQVNAKLVLASSADSTSGVQVGRTDELQCSQHQPARNHHCVLVVPWARVEIARTKLACNPSCSLNLVASSWSNDAKHGHVLVIGADSHGPIKGDKGRVNAVVYADASDPVPRPTVSTKFVDRHLPIIDDGAGDPIFKVVYSARIDNPREGDQFMVDARAITKIGSVDYNVEMGTEVIVTKKPPTTRAAGVAVFTHPSSQVSELNGINCTQKASAHQTPCVRDKFGVFEITKDRSKLYVNVVQGAEAKITNQHHSDRDRAKFIDGGYLKVTRFD